MSCYENAPATKMLATACAICARPLLDAKSVEIGIGPICRDKYGYGELSGLTEEVRIEANKAIHAIACDQDGPKVIPNVKRLMELGLTGVVSAVLARVAVVKLATTPDGRYAVKSPYSDMATSLFRTVAGRRWDKERKLNVFPASSKEALFEVLKRAYPGAIAVGPKGVFYIPTPADSNPTDEPPQPEASYELSN